MTSPIPSVQLGDDITDLSSFGDSVTSLFEIALAERHTGCWLTHC